jgi:hypothetical protein
MNKKLLKARMSGSLEIGFRPLPRKGERRTDYAKHWMHFFRCARSGPHLIASTSRLLPELFLAHSFRFMCF